MKFLKTKTTALSAAILAFILSFTACAFAACSKVDDSNSSDGNGGTASDTPDGNGNSTNPPEGSGGTTTTPPQDAWEAPEPVIGTNGIQYQLNYDETGYLVSGIDGDVTEKNIVISSEYDGKPVTGIGYWAFSNNSNIESVTIPFSVEEIEEFAFYDCENLKTVSIGKGVKIIGKSAFEGCDCITDVKLPESVNWIGESAFSYCSLIKSLTLPKNLEYLGGRAFYNCASLTDVTVYDNLRSMGSFAFYGCDNIKTTEYNNGLYIGNENNKYAVLLDIKNKDVSEMTLHADAKIIGGSAALNCASLTSIILPQGLKMIGDVAFGRCGALTEIVLPSSVIEVGADAFNDCDKLLIYCQFPKISSWGTMWYDNQPVIWDCDNNDKDEHGYAYTTVNGLRYCVNSEKTYLTHIISLPGPEIVVPSNITYKNVSYNVYGIDFIAFGECNELTKIIIPGTVKVIAESAFSDCRNLQEVILGNGIEKIAVEAFDGCRSLKTITIPDSVNEIGSFAFDGCYNLTINCEALSKPYDWSSNWNPLNRPVTWGYRGV